MASKDLVKGYCKESKCEYDVYTKEKMDELLADVSTKIGNKQNTLTFDSTPTSGSTNPVTSGGVYSSLSSVNTSINNINSSLNTINTTLSSKMNSNKFAVLTGTITGTGGGSVDVNYPSGFTKDNCIVIGQMINNFGGSSFVSGAGYSSSINPVVRLKNDKIGITINADSTSSVAYGYRIMLMRID